MVLFSDDDVKELQNWAVKRLWDHRDDLSECKIHETVQVLGYLLAAAAGIACWLSGQRFKT